MDSKEEEPNADGQHHNMATQNSDTVALQKKRARRVSFAEMTSVHFFDRDDEECNETPSAKNGDNSSGEESSSKKFVSEDNGDEIYDDEDMEMRRSFFRPVGSPSPVGSTFGSASSNDAEDDFFGPVSANFIRPGRLSGSVASDDNHDVTMDSTAFSMHYRSLARSESGVFGPVSANFIRPGGLSGSAASDDNYDVTMDSTAFSMHYHSLARSESGVDLRTPTGSQLFFEEKTPTNPSAGSSMDFTLGKKLVPSSSAPVTEVSGSHSPNVMSLVRENPNEYDYDKLSPGLDAILAESRKNLLSVSVSDDIFTSMSPKRKSSEVFPSPNDGDNLVNLSNDAREETCWINSPDVPNGDEFAACTELREANGLHETFPSGLSPERISSDVLGATASNGDHYKANSSPYVLGNDESKTSLVASTSPLRQQNLLPTASPSKHLGVATPKPDQSGSLLRNENIGHQKTETSIQKSISKLELLEKSAFSSAFSAKVDKSTIKLLDFSKSPNFNTFLEKQHISRTNLVQDSVTQDKLANVHQSKERTNALSTDHMTVERLSNINHENHLEKHVGQIMIGESPHQLSAKNPSIDQSKYRGASVSPSKITWSGNNLMRSLFTSKHSDEDAVMTKTESLLPEIASGDGGKAIRTTNFPSPSRMLEKKFPASPGLQSSQSEILLQQSLFKQILGSDKGQGSSPERNLADVKLSSADANMDDVSMGLNGELSSPFLEVNSLNNLKASDEREDGIYNGGEILGTIDNFSASAKVNKSHVMHSRIVDVVNQTSLEISTFKDNLPREDFTTAVHGSVSPSASRSLHEPTLQNPVEFPTTSSSRKERDDKQSSRLHTPKTTQLSGRLEHICASKRNLELLMRDMQHRTEMAIMQKSSKLQKSGNSDPERLFYPYEGKGTQTGHERNNWTETYSKFSEDIKVIISGSADKLNSKMIDKLELALIRQQKSKIYETLCAGVMPQNTIVLPDLQLEKIAEKNTLLQRVVFGKAKLLLKHVKRDRLLRRLELLSSRIQECKELRAKLSSQQFGACTTKLKVAAVDRPLSINLKKGDEVCPEKLATMRQGLEVLERNILNMTRHFHACCKIKGEPSIAETISVVNQHLIKRASCRFIRLDMQMWVVQSVSTENRQHNIVLNFLDFVIQSIKIVVGPTSSITTLFKLNETKIVKNFPNLDVFIAFTFVFNNAENSRKYLGAKTLVQENQVTSSLLGTLLDVLEEVQVAQLEFRNLIQSGFSLPSAARLDLMLCLFNFNSGMKVTLRLDMSCLKRGIYPSDIIPLELTSLIDSQKSSLCGPIFDEIRDAVKGVGTGYMRILRLCRCISQVIQMH